ncbi:hypothetical protein [Halomicrococcus sp. NG-SE-24]|uniref:hypothetical protein n=1 Tax=Halomicrococcus sp. NG-SE-24 TaxID=3436928 RepID=UPI003D97E326
MEETTQSIPEDAVWVADSGVFIACGRQQGSKYTALERFAQRNGITFVIPQRVYEELGGAPERSTPGQSPINSAIDSGWVTVADELDYTNATVSSVMDDIRSFIASNSNRSEDAIEKADTALGGVAAQLLISESASAVCILTTDVDAGTGVVAVLEAHGFEGQISFKDGFELIAELTSSTP